MGNRRGHMSGPTVTFADDPEEHDPSSVERRLTQDNISLKKVRSLFHGLPRSSSYDNTLCSTRRPRRKALLISCGYCESPHETMKLKNSWKDVDTMRKLLLSNDWKDDEITILVDYCGDESVPLNARKGRTRPTKRNIMKALRKLAKNAQPGDLLVLHMSGHGGQRVAVKQGHTEGDTDVFFTPCDYWKGKRNKKKKGVLKQGDLELGTASKILDSTLRQTVVDPLPDGAKLIAVIDCCSGGPLLHLPYEGERDGFQARVLKATKLVTAPVRKLFTSPRRKNSAGSSTSTSTSNRSPKQRKSSGGSANSTTISPILLPDVQTNEKCVGRQGRLVDTNSDSANEPRATVISISSCPAGAYSYDTENGGILVTVFANALKQDRGHLLSLGELHDFLRKGQEATHKNMKEKIEEKKGTWRESWKAPIPQFSFSHPWSWEDSFSISTHDNIQDSPQFLPC